jgi:hypothetical protein
MKTRNLVSLAILTVAAVGAAVYSVRVQNIETESVQALPPLFPNLAAKINTIDEIDLKSHTDSTVIKRMADGSWVIASKDNYPAKFDMVKKTIVGLTDMKTVDAKTNDPKLFGELGLADVTADDSKAKLIDLKSGGKTVAGALFGERKYVPGVNSARAYVRKPDGGRAWLVDNAPSIETAPKSWWVEDTVAVPRERVKEAILSGPDRGTLTVYRDKKDDKNFKVRDMPAGAKLQYDGAPDSIAEALAYMSFDDVKPVADIDFSKADSAVFRTFDGLEVTANIAMADKATWVKFEAKALPGAEHPEAADETKSADDAASKDKDQAKDKAKPKPLDVPAEAKAINDRVQGWAYEVASYKAKDLTKKLSDLLAKDEKKTDKASKPSPNGT